MKRSAALALFIVLVFFSAEQLHGQGNAISLDGIDDFVQVNASIIPTAGNFTVSVWAKQNSSQIGYVEILSQYNFYLGCNDIGYFRVGDWWQVVDVLWPTDHQWHNYTVVKARTYTQLFIDGDLKATGPAIGNPSENSFRIGKQWGSWGEYFHGEIDELAVWNRNLSEAEVQANMYTLYQGNEIGLVSLWRFDEPFGSNKTYDSVGGNVGTFDGIPQFIESGANLGNAIGLDGIDDYIQVNSSVIPPSGDFTVSFWAKMDYLYPEFREVLSQSGGPGGTNFYFGRHESGWIRVGDDWQDTMIRWPINDLWHYFTAVKNSTNTYLYLDGALQACKRVAINNPAGDEFRIGRQYGDWGEYFNGQIDELNIWSRALAQNEVAANMYVPLRGDELGLIALFHFDEPYGSTFTLESITGQIFAIGPQFVSSGAMSFLSIIMDIKPGSDRNPINLNSRGMIPVALMTTSEFMANTVDVNSLEFGPNGAHAADDGRLTDVDNDGDIDLAVNFDLQSAGITLSDNEVFIKGITTAGIIFRGKDNITHVGRGLMKETDIENPEDALLPHDYCLFQNYPNPFNPSTNIKYMIPINGKVSIKVCNILGTAIATLVDEEKEPGYYEINFDGSNLSSGVYICRMQCAGFTDSKKLILLK